VHCSLPAGDCWNFPTCSLYVFEVFRTLPRSCSSSVPSVSLGPIAFFLLIRFVSLPLCHTSLTFTQTTFCRRTHVFICCRPSLPTRCIRASQPQRCNYFIRSALTTFRVFGSQWRRLQFLGIKSSCVSCTLYHANHDKNGRSVPSSKIWQRHEFFCRADICCCVQLHISFWATQCSVRDISEGLPYLRRPCRHRVWFWLRLLKRRRLRQDRFDSL
jgi:hypothetical protein